MKKLRNYRHGDMALIGIEKLPNELKASKSKVLMVGSGGNNHSISNGEFYPKKEGIFTIGYLKAENTELLHKEHGKKVNGKLLDEAKIEDGFYRIVKQQEDTHEGMKPVID